MRSVIGRILPIVLVCAHFGISTEDISPPTSDEIDDNEAETGVTLPEISDYYYIYVSGPKDLTTFIRHLDGTYKILKADNTWYLNKIRQIGYVLKIPVLKGKEAYFKKLLDKYGMPVMPEQIPQNIYQYPRTNVDEAPKVNVWSSRSEEATVESKPQPWSFGSTRYVYNPESTTPETTKLSYKYSNPRVGYTESQSTQYGPGTSRFWQRTRNPSSSPWSRLLTRFTPGSRLPKLSFNTRPSRPYGFSTPNRGLWNTRSSKIRSRLPFLFSTAFAPAVQMLNKMGKRNRNRNRNRKPGSKPFLRFATATAPSFTGKGRYLDQRRLTTTTTTTYKPSQLANKHLDLRIRTTPGFTKAGFKTAPKSSNKLGLRMRTTPVGFTKAVFETTPKSISKLGLRMRTTPGGFTKAGFETTSKFTNKLGLRARTITKAPINKGMGIETRSRFSGARIRPVTERQPGTITVNAAAGTATTQPVKFKKDKSQTTLTTGGVAITSLATGKSAGTTGIDYATSSTTPSMDTTFSTTTDSTTKCGFSISQVTEIINRIIADKRLSPSADNQYAPFTISESEVEAYSQQGTTQADQDMRRTVRKSLIAITAPSNATTTEAITSSETTTSPVLPETTTEEVSTPTTTVTPATIPTSARTPAMDLRPQEKPGLFDNIFSIFKDSERVANLSFKKIAERSADNSGGGDYLEELDN